MYLIVSTWWSVFCATHCSLLCLSLTFMRRLFYIDCLSVRVLISSNIFTYVGVALAGQYKAKGSAFAEFLENSAALIQDGESLFRDWQVAL